MGTHARTDESAQDRRLDVRHGAGTGRRAGDSRAIAPRADRIIRRALESAAATDAILAHVSSDLPGGSFLRARLIERGRNRLGIAARATTFALLASRSFRQLSSFDVAAECAALAARSF